MTTLRCLALGTLFLLAGCSHQVPTVTVDVIDTSLSITPRAEKAVLGAVGDQILTLGRGDRLILIPITGDAENDAGGRILRLQAPTNREPYDTDLRQFRTSARKQFTAWTATIRAEPERTDILGAVDAAEQEIGALPKGSSSTLVIMSDFLEDDGTYNFDTNRELANPPRARVLALRLRAQHGVAPAGACIGLGRLESSELASLSPERIKAVTAFWQSYLGDRNHRPEMLFDGLTLLNGQDAVCSRRRR